MIENKRGKTTTSQEPVGFVALDPTRLQIQLETPVSYFLQLLAHPALFPVHRSMRGVFSQHQPIDPHAIVCSGPFKIKSYKDQVEIILEKNTRYHDSSLVALERIYMSRITDPQTALALFEKGQLDWLGLPLSSLPVDAMEDLQKKGVLQVHPLLDTRFLYFNTKQYPFINVNLRRALTLAINREAIVKEVLHTSDFPALGYVPFAQKREKWHPFFQDHDEKGAKECFRQALAELHLKADELPEITLCYNTSDMWRRVIQVIQEQWRTVLGVRVKIENTDWHVHMDRLRHGQFQVARAGRSADFVDALSFLQHLLSFNTTQNFCRWENREFDQLLQLAESGRSDQERSLCLEKAEALMMQEMPIAPLVYLNAYTISHPDLKGVIVSPLYYVDFSKAYFESKK